MNKLWNEKTNRGKTWEKIGVCLPIALCILTAFVLARYFDTSSLKGYLDKNEGIGLFISAYAYISLGLAFIPPDPIALLVLAWKGPVAAIVLETFGNTLLAIIDFYCGTNDEDLAVLENKKAKLPFYLDRFPITSPVILIFARLLPGFGSKFVNIVSRVNQLPKRTILWTTVVANLLEAAVIVYGGSGLIQLFRINLAGGERTSLLAAYFVV